MKEVQQALKEAQWADDSAVKNCQQCQKPFSVSRRKVSKFFWSRLLICLSYPSRICLSCVFLCSKKKLSAVTVFFVKHKWYLF